MTDTVHPIAARGFDAGADAYERGRPDYPAEAVASIVNLLELRPGRVLLELGAGTGKMTRQLAPAGARILAIEPVAGMRAKLVDEVPDAELLDGTAEAVPLPAGSVDAVVAAQAFHWFDTIRALSEIHRVLRPGGRVALVWNLRDESVPWVRRLGECIERATGGEAPNSQRGWRERVDRCGLFEPLETSSFRHVQRLSVDGVLDRVVSVSTVAAAAVSVREGLVAEIRSLLATDPDTAGRTEFDLPYDTKVYWAARRSPVPGTVGVVASVNVNRGGVPKPPVDGSRILWTALDGDGHREPESIHGGLDRAVCVYAQEAIERIRDGGDVAFPGAYGENLTLLGIDWGSLATGDRLAIGPGREGEAPGEGGDGAGALIELTEPATPRQSIAHYFAERRIARVSHKVHPEDARWYARVLREGPVAPGMAVRVVPRWGVQLPDRATLRGVPTGGTMSASEQAGDTAPATTREELLVRHLDARRRRNAAVPGGHEWEQASAEVGRIEIEIARIERAMEPPLV
jgi:MOSC domain-containing protein YiiM